MLHHTSSCNVRKSYLPCFIVIPTSFTAYKAQPINGSSATALCSNFSETDSLDSFQCNTPASSVLFDGKIPPLTLWYLDNEPSWAGQLFTAQQNDDRGKYKIHFDFTGQPDYAGVRMMELIVFNCPVWGVSLQAIADDIGSTHTAQIESCAYLVTACYPLQTSKRQFSIEFLYLQWMHLAEIVFYEGYCPCTLSYLSSPTTLSRISDKCESIGKLPALIIFTQL